jgi:hypothetical protein
MQPEKGSNGVAYCPVARNFAASAQYSTTLK